MSRKKNLWIFIGSVIFVAALISGFVLTQTSAGDILVGALETAKTITDGHAVVAIEVDSIDKDASGTIEVWAYRNEDGPGAFRVEVLESSEEKSRGAVIVSDGETLWAYSPGENKVFVLTKRPARSIAMGGASAGGGITMSAVQQIIKLDVDVPGALYLGTPGSDLSGTGDTFHTNQGVDRNIPTYDGIVEAMVSLYAADLDLKDPRISPIYGDFVGFPPTILVSGTRDLFLSNTVRTHTRLRQAGSAAYMLVFEGVSHADYLVELASPESQLFLADLNRFFAQHLQFSARPAARMMARMNSALGQSLRLDPSASS
ncbi:MAG TPA: alpha/beta hydrolase fold domain-containing protein [Anaerolineales bacterium]|nr:alpha/beta hydrolase fold domain-containing protein [Anaerolineales bacterium]